MLQKKPHGFYLPSAVFGMCSEIHVTTLNPRQNDEQVLHYFSSYWNVKISHKVNMNDCTIVI